MEAIVMTLLLYGQGNAVVVPHTFEGYLQSLEPISAHRVSFMPDGYRDYKVLIDGNTVTLTDPDTHLDLGGIAKGHPTEDEVRKAVEFYKGLKS